MSEQTIGSFLKESGRSAEELADYLSEALGRGVTAKGVRARQTRPMPKSWAKALGGAEGSPSPSPGDPPGVGDTHTRAAEQDPRPLGDSPLALPPARMEAFAQKRIAAVYGFVGAGIGQAVGNPGVEKVWDDHSPEIARAWIEAAETSPFARRVVDLFTAGGPMGEVVMLHLTLLAGTMYVVGQFPEVGLFAKYRSYRPPAAGASAEPEPDEPGRNGAGDFVAPVGTEALA